MILLHPYRFIGGGNDAHTTLLIHCDGADASTTFTDVSATAATVTANGNAQVDTGQSVFGGASCQLDGTGDYLSVPSNAAYNIAGGDSCLDWRVRFSVVGTTVTMLNRFNGGTGAGWTTYKDNSNLVNFYSNNGAVLMTGTTALSVNTWYHIAVTRAGSTWRLFVNGTQEATSTAAGSDEATSLLMGSRSGILEMTGWLDEIRISKGAARWVDNFTPPTSAYA